MTEQRHFLDTFFYPQSIAVVGVSRDPLKTNHNLFANLVKMKFQGRIYPVNPNITELLGVKAYPRLSAIDDEIDLAVCGVPARSTLGVIEECIAKGVRAVVIVAGGFSEIGEEGKRVQAEIARLLREAGIRALGPNALSPINTANDLIIGFGPHDRMNRGGISFIFQSGLYEPRFDWLLFKHNIGICKLIDLGNKMDINEVEALEYLAADPDTRVIAIHMESIAGDGRRFLQIVRDTAVRKPIVVIKSGRTPAGSRAASSHTGAMVRGSDAVFDAALKQAGAIRAYTLEEFFDYAKTFDIMVPLKLMGNRIALATLSGGEGVITTDLCHDRGMAIAQVGAETFRRLQQVAPPWEIAPNPFDIGVCGQFHSQGEVLQAFVEAMSDDEGVDCIAVQMGLSDFMTSKEQLEPFLGARAKGTPLAVWPIEGLHESASIVQWLEQSGVPVYLTAERMLKSFSALHRYSLMAERIGMEGAVQQSGGSATGGPR